MVVQRHAHGHGPGPHGHGHGPRQQLRPPHVPHRRAPQQRLPHGHAHLGHVAQCWLHHAHVPHALGQNYLLSFHNNMRTGLTKANFKPKSHGIKLTHAACRRLTCLTSILVLGFAFYCLTVPYMEKKHMEKIVRATKSSIPVSTPAEDWNMATGVAREIQRDYCIRRYTGDPPRDDILKVNFHAPASEVGYDFFIYKEGDDVSHFIRNTVSYEGALLAELQLGMEKASEYLNIAHKNLYFMDIGGNIGTHTVYLQSLGYHGLTFEPMLANEDLIRSNLCANDIEHRVTLFTKGLSDSAGVCNVYTPPGNTGDGIVDCSNGDKGSIESQKNGLETDGFLPKGRLEVTTPDAFMYAGDIMAPHVHLPVGVLKMDVEGFELKVVLGGKKFFATARIPYIVMEIWGLRQNDLEELMAFFRSLGYKLSIEGFFTGMSEDPRDGSRIQDLYFALI